MKNMFRFLTFALLMFALLLLPIAPVSATTNDEMYWNLGDIGPQPMRTYTQFLTNLSNFYTEYTDNYVIFPVLPQDFNVDLDGRNTPAHAFMKGSHHDSFKLIYPVPDSITKWPSTVECIDVEVSLRGRIKTYNYDTEKYDIVKEPYTKSNWKELIISEIPAKDYREITSANGKELLFLDNFSSEISFRYKIYGLTEDNFLYWGNISGRNIEGDAEAQDAYRAWCTEILANLVSEIQFVNLPLDATEEEAKAIVASVDRKAFEVPSQKQSDKGVSVDDPNEGLEASDIVTSETMDDSYEFSEAPQNSAVFQQSEDAQSVDKDTDGDNNSTTVIAIVVIAVVVLGAISVIAIKAKGKKKSE